MLLKNGFLVRSYQFERHQSIGNPVIQANRYNDWCVDELIYLDITRDDRYDLRRNDQKLQRVGGALDILRLVSQGCFMPLTFGGKIRTIADMDVRFESGADKIAINTIAFEDPDMITRAARRFGSQAIVISIDAKREDNGEYVAYTHNGSRPAPVSLHDFVSELESRGAGEILINSIDQDGTGDGYDIDLIRLVTSRTRLPVIACGGVGDYSDFAEAFTEGGASAAAAANIFNFRELSDRMAKRSLIQASIDIRPID